MSAYYAVRWIDGVVSLLDQRLLPQEKSYLEYSDYRSLAEAIRVMVVRGAPAIGATAAFGMALAAQESKAQSVGNLISDLGAAAAHLKNARPTAVNLSWAVDRVFRRALNANPSDVLQLRAVVLAESQAIADEDAEACRQMGSFGLMLIPEKAGIIHHCNTGALATSGIGTALGVIRTAHEAGRQVHVYVDETRPRLQGARLTTWELSQLGIPYTLIVDGASGFFMRQGKVQLCLVGCDRIAANGDTANKIGTYNLALAAYAHDIPFYVVGPTSTIDLSACTGDHIPVEFRDEAEVKLIGGYPTTSPESKASNPAFDITPAKYIRAIVTERGIVSPPYEDGLPNIMNG